MYQTAVTWRRLLWNTDAGRRIKRGRCFGIEAEGLIRYTKLFVAERPATPSFGCRKRLVGDADFFRENLQRNPACFAEVMQL